MNRREILAIVDEKVKNSICVKLPNNSLNEKQTTCSEYYPSDQALAFLRISPDGIFIFFCFNYFLLLKPQLFKYSLKLKNWNLEFTKIGKKLASVLEDGMNISIWDLENLKVKSMQPEFSFRRSMFLCIFVRFMTSFSYFMLVLKYF